MRLLHAILIAPCISASVAGCTDVDVCGASRLACQRGLEVEENSRDMVNPPRGTEGALQNSSLGFW